MTDVVGAALASWTLPAWPAAGSLLTALLYLRGWRRLSARRPQHFGLRHLACFVAGLASVLLAVASPLDAFAGLLLQVHMLQHVLLTMVAPPLLWLGAPTLPLLRGLPARLAKRGLAPFLTWPALRRVGRGLAHPLGGWLALMLATALWHLPGPYQLALRSPGWHELEHACFLVAGLWFWFPVVQPYPSRPRWPRWAMIPYLLLADVANTGLAALFAFAGRPLYPAYSAVPALTAGGPLGDQAMAGALMWVTGSIAYLAAVAAIVVEWLESPRSFPRLLRFPPLKKGGQGGFPEHSSRAARAPAGSWKIPPYPPSSKGGVGAKGGYGARGGVGLDLLHLPYIAPLLRSLAFRRAIQALMLLLAAAVVLDGFLGPRMSPMNLAGVLPWTYWRGLVVVALLAVGNLFCFACPFMLPRELAKRVIGARRAWPRWLRGKWLAVALLLAYLASYELFDLWDRPAATATLVLAYFGAAFAIDAVFRGASFCKHVCPIGQFHFVHAGASPFELTAREPGVCAGCTTHDCLRGGSRGRGCELDLFVPRKRDSLDCTLCLDCVRACPHDNVALRTVAPGRALPGRRRGARLDLAALALLCVFGAFANAAGMLEPLLARESDLAVRLGLTAPTAITAAWLVVALVLVPAASATLAARLSARGAGVPGARTIACRFAFALVPLGLGMWSAHFLFHLLSGLGSLWPVVQRAAFDLGSTWLGPPAWAHGMGPRTDWLTALELLLLDAGLVVTVVVGWRTARELGGDAARALRVAAPWAALALLLWVSGVWIVFQPMQMRGMVH
ncbi:MAG: cytochrome c oxidase assembly protein [Deltaproteobacteria bacterium]|nr:cytochrome c oxidase assembly protein [Deltaproteobacteria bacterium]